MFLGAPTWVFDGATPFDVCIRNIKKAGLKGVEMIIWNEQAITQTYTRDNIKFYRDLIADLGMTLSEFVVPASTSSSEDAKVRAHAVDLFRRGIAVAAELGTRNINICSPYPFSINFPELRTLPSAAVFSMGVDMNRDWKGNYHTFVETVQNFCDYCAEYGLNLLIEPHPYRWVDDVGTFLRLYERVGRGNLYTNFDTNHTFACGEMPQNAPYQLRELMPHVHCSDNDGLFNAHWRPGKGKIDWREFVKALKDIDFKGCASFEIGGPSKNEHRQQELEDTVRFFTRICDEAGIELEA